jgi:hypothetical protein
MQEELPAAIERARASLDDATFDAPLLRGTAMDFRDNFARGEIELALAAPRHQEQSKCTTRGAGFR